VNLPPAKDVPTWVGSSLGVGLGASKRLRRLLPKWHPKLDGSKMARSRMARSKMAPQVGMFQNGRYQDGRYQDGTFQDGTFQNGKYQNGKYLVGCQVGLPTQVPGCRSRRLILPSDFSLGTRSSRT